MFLLPDIKLERITEITVAMLEKRGINALILDVDNTLSTHHGQQLTEGLVEWLALMRENGIKMTVLSNSTTKRLSPFAEKIGLDFIAMGLKPLPFGYLRAIKALGSEKKNTAIVGDQVFTDTAGGNLVGLTTVLLTPIKPESSPRFRFKRMLEKKILKHYNVQKTEE